MENGVLFENTTRVRENGTSDIDVLYAARNSGEKKSREKEIIFTVIFFALFILLIAVFAGLGWFGEEYRGRTARTAAWPIGIALAVSFPVSVAATMLYMRMKHGANEGITAETSQNFVSYSYRISDSGINVSHEGRTDEIGFGDISQITANGYAYYICAGGKKYQLGRNGFGGRETEFHQFLQSKGFSIGVEP